MTKQHCAILFLQHSEDLTNLVPGLKDVFVCPICFTLFSPDSIDKELVDVGHVWPKYFRSRSDLAKHQHVLLCKSCNSSAGYSGDEIMQVEAELHAGRKTGNLGLRKIRVSRPSTFNESIELEAYIQETGELGSNIRFPEPKKKSQKLYFDEQKKKFFDFTAEEPFNITIYPPRANPRNPFGDPKNAALAQAGFLTSAYLLAFFTYGYTYIFQTCLDPVREYISQSFDKNVDDRLKFDDYKDTCIQLCPDTSHFREDPEIGLVISSDEAIPLFQEVWFLDYHVRLPIPNVGVDRLVLIAQFIEWSGQSSNNVKEIQSIYREGFFISNLDHPFLKDLQKSI